MMWATRKQPNLFWKLLSYLFDLPLEHLSSEFNPSIHLYLSKGELKLVSHKAIYSYGLRYEHFVDAFKKIQIEYRKPEKILILGLGTGSIPHMLQNQFKVKANYDFVERDPEVIFLFEKYLEYIYTGPYRFYCEDGMKFMEENLQKYDLVCMDIFDDNLVPKKFESEKFLYLLKASLSKNGILLYNRLNADSEDHERNKHFLETFQLAFPQFRILKHDYNWIFMAENNES